MASPRIILFGSNGQIGWELVQYLGPWADLIALNRHDIDLVDESYSRIRELIQSNKPEVVINAAAYTDVDGAEADKSEARRINALAPAVMASECDSLGCMFVHYSTDYVFNGQQTIPYTEFDTPDPVNHYGHTKLEGESAIHGSTGPWLILRTSWVYSLRRSSFPVKVLQWARSKRVLRIVDDQVGSPTWAKLIAELTNDLVRMRFSHGEDWMKERTGIYHLAGKGGVSRYHFAKEILSLDPFSDEHIFEHVFPAKSDEFPLAAQRPRFTVLDCRRLEESFGISLSPWTQSLKLAMKNEVQTQDAN